VRELDNVMQRALVLVGGSHILPADLLFEEDDGTGMSDGNPTLVAEPPEGLLEGRRVAEEKIILETLRDANGSRKSAAERLGISQRTLRYKIARMRESGVPVPGGV
jgi:two-component system response regulator FlrC